MIERISEAIYREFEARPAYAQTQMNGHLATELAIAAVRAMREPTPEMVRAGQVGPTIMTWKAMIDQILKEADANKR